MKIDGFSVQMSSRHQAETRYSRTENARVWIDSPQTSQAPRQVEDLLDLSGQSKRLKESSLTPSPEDILAEDPKLMIIKRMIEILTGREVKIGRISIEEPGVEIERPATGVGASGSAPPAREGWGARYDLDESYQESESTSVSARGIVKTADGREISFTLDLQMNRQYAEQNNVSIRAGDALKDPLVINFGGTAASLTGEKISFDFDADGAAESLPGLAAGSGYLVFDRNADGKVNNGTELFGPTTGRGFEELAGLDGDGNGWIDEADANFGRLYTWTGKDSLTSLSKSGIAAILTTPIDSAFDLKDSSNRLLGRVQQTGIFLTEQGLAGSVQRIDIAA